MGFRFNGATGTAGTQYGWAKVKTENFGGSDTQGVRLRILEWAYDNSGAAITVGDVGPAPAVPNPATPLLALLGLGVLGVQGYRRRRDEGLKRVADESNAAGA